MTTTVRIKNEGGQPVEVFTVNTKGEGTKVCALSPGDAFVSHVHSSQRLSIKEADAKAEPTRTRVRRPDETADTTETTDQ